MPKSKYPVELDTSKEIPPVRDNILEVGSDVINSLRSAIFNIERVLGINPQGAVGNTVAERLGRSLDGNGNIRPDALDRTNILTGPILDADVSKVAAIKESKLKLDYPTTLLQDEISILNTSIENIVSQVEQVVLELATHTNTSALNRHPALSISVEEHTSVPSDIATKDLESGDVQSAFETLYDSHINYSGESITAENSSHTASQVFFDNVDVSALVPSENVQGAIEDLVEVASDSSVSHQDSLHSNGILRRGEIDTPELIGFGNLLEDDIQISFFKASGGASNTTTITIDETIDLADFNLKKSDIITISDEGNPSASYIGSYEIESFTETSGVLNSITIYGTFSEDSTSLTRGRITKQTSVVTNSASLLVSAREEATLTAARSVQICNPNSVKVISSGIRPKEITTTKRYINVAINNGTPEQIDLYNGLVSEQSIDSIVSRINEQCSEDALDFFAYRLDIESGGSELVIAHNLPDSTDERFTLTISRGSDGGIDAAGLSHIEDVEVSSEFGSVYYIKGRPYEGLNVKLDSTTMSFLTTSVVVSSGSSGLDFLNEGIRAQDLVVISNAPNSADNGTYVIESVTSNQLELSSGQLPSGFASASDSETRFRIYSNIASFNDIVFDEVGATFGAVVADIFLDRERKVVIDKKFEYTTELLGSSSLVTLVDFIGDIEDKSFSLVISEGTDSVELTLDSGTTHIIRGTNSYIWVDSGQENVWLKLYIPSVDNLITHIGTLGSDVTMTFYGFQGLNPDSNLHLARVSFGNFNGRVAGGIESPRVLSKLSKGNIGLNEISSKYTYEKIQLPRSELRSNGVVSNLEVTNATLTSNLFTFDLDPGICYVGGKRIEVSKKTAIVTDIDATVADKMYIAIDEDGQIVFEAALPGCEITFENSAFCILSTLEYDGTTVYNIDLRFFINDIDLKLLNSITVSPQAGMGHFNDFGKAIKYAERFSNFFPNAGTPTVHLKSGTYNITTEFDNSSITYLDWLALGSGIWTDFADGLQNAGLLINFPINIIGEGDSTELVIRNRYIYSDVTYTYKGILGILGNGFVSHTVPIYKLTDGVVKFKDFKMNNSKITAVDLNLLDGADNLTFAVEIDSITFDHRNFDTPNPVDNLYKFRSIALTEIDDNVTEKGGLIINNCKFIIDETETSGSAIYILNSQTAKSISITNNRLINAEVGTSLISQDIFDFNNFDTGSNIYVAGNMAASNFATANGGRPEIFPGGSIWGDRTSRALYVGGNIETNNDVIAADDITAMGNFVADNDYTYSTTKNKDFMFLWFNAYDCDYGPGTGTSTSYINKVSGTDGFWFQARIPSGSNNGAFYHFTLPPGLNIDSIELGLSEQGSGNHDWTIELHQYYLNGSSYASIYGPATVTASGGIATYNSIGLTSNENVYVLEITHDQSFENGCKWIKISTSFTELQDALGAY